VGGSRKPLLSDFSIHKMLLAENGAGGSIGMLSGLYLNAGVMYNAQ
jgi:hypothetical protein